MEINWDDVAEELGDTPRARLAQALAEADDMLAVVIVFETKTGQHLSGNFDYRTGLVEGAGASSLLGLIEWAKTVFLAGMTSD